ncbi:MAG: hypothetical protein HOP35_14345, partial [Nitrospira sp.]|nr:hypothetical protein [Nitrospira sp.]
MYRFFCTRLVSIVLGGIVFSPLPPAYAMEPGNNQEFTLEKPVYVFSPRGVQVQLLPGSYRMAPLADSVQVTSIDKNRRSVELAVTLDTHEQNLSEPMAVSVQGLSESDSSDRHILALFLPGGLVYEVTGSYSGIRSRDVDPHSLISDPTEILLEKAVHFLGPDGNDLVVQPGIYSVKGEKQGIRLTTPVPANSFLLEARPDKKSGSLEVPVALSLPGNAEDEADLHYLVLMDPQGDSLHAVGTYSGIRQRGPFDGIASGASKTLNAAKSTVNRVGQGAQRTTQQIGAGLQKTGQDVGRLAQKAALDAKQQAEWVARQAAQGALIAAQAACKAGFTAARITSELHARILGPVMQALAKSLALDKTQAALRQAIEVIKRQQGPAIQHAMNAGLILTEPNNIRTVNQLMDPNHMCEQPAATVQNTFQSMIGAPIRAALTESQNAATSQVRTRGSVASASIGLGGNLAKGVGGELGVSHAFDFLNKSHWYLDLAAMLKSNVGGGGGVSIGIYPKVNPDEVGGWFLGVGVGFPFPHPKLAKSVE